ncbi:lipocalin family protein [Algoriphagus aestuarii]|nr:lipocalin family protein [Algoriphagus aestuarii]
MNLPVIYSLVLTFVLNLFQVQHQELIGSWQLVDFDGIKKIKSSPEYLSSSAAFRADLETKIQYRLENTVYTFMEGDSLAYTDFVNKEIALRKAKVEINDDNLMTIQEGKDVKQAKILEFDGNKLVLEPISTNGKSAGKLVFEKIIVKKEK